MCFVDSLPNYTKIFYNKKLKTKSFLDFIYDAYKDAITVVTVSSIKTTQTNFMIEKCLFYVIFMIAHQHS